MIWRVRQALPDLGQGDTAIPSSDGTEVYEFDKQGREIRAVDSLTAVTKYSFAYDSAGRLTSITDRYGNVTTIQRDSSGNPAAIVAPGGQRTPLSLGSDGFLSSIADPAGDTQHMTYGSGGLMTSFSRAGGGVEQFGYDGLGRLTRAQSATGVVTTLARTDTITGFSVAVTTGGRTTTYEVNGASNGDYERKVTRPGGAVTDDVISPTVGDAFVTYPDGSSDRTFVGPDPRFGLAAPVTLFEQRQEPNGGDRTFSTDRQITLSDPSNVLSVTKLTDTITPLTAAKAPIGNSATVAWDAATRTLTTTSPEGRKEVKTLDSNGDVITDDLGTGLDPLHYTYDSHGRLTVIKAGTATVEAFTYNDANELVSRANAATETTTYTYDPAGRIATVTTPDQLQYRFSDYVDGNPTQVTMPNLSVHKLSYSADDSQTSYQLPDGSTYANSYDPASDVYGAAGGLASITLPGGRKTTVQYDAGGRLSQVSFPEATDAFSYASGDPTNRATSVTRTPAGGGTAEGLAYSYNGDLIASAEASGTSVGHYDYTYDGDTLNLTDLSLTSGSDTVDVQRSYDQDRLLTQDGGFTVDRSGPAGDPASYSDSTVGLSLTEDTRGRPASRALSVAGTEMYHLTLTRDGSGRIVDRKEKVYGTQHDYTYSYDPDGRLLQVKRDGTLVESYAYDANGNRTGAGVGGSAQTAMYDTSDVLTKVGGTSYTFDSDGFMTKRGSDSFTYDAAGELLSATAAGHMVTYRYDGYGRRVARIGPDGTTQYLYGEPSDPYLVTATRAPDGTLTTYFYDQRGLLYAINRGGSEYGVATDQVGSPKLVIDSSGTVVEQRDYDSYGRLLSDSNPSFGLAIGFAGGLDDPVTGLVRFGLRDYDPSTGRFAARDPLLLEGDSLNLFAYVGDDPVDQVDATGLNGGSSPSGKGAPNFGPGAAGDKFKDNLKDQANEAAKEYAKGGVKGVKDYVKDQYVKNPGDEYRDQLNNSAEGAKSGGSGLWGQLKCLWERAAGALGGGAGCGSNCQ